MGGVRGLHLPSGDASNSQQAASMHWCHLAAAATDAISDAAGLCTRPRPLLLLLLLMPLLLQASVPALGHFLLYPKQEQGPDCIVKVREGPR